MNDAPPSTTVPRLHTERLLLRELRTGDFEAFAAHMADPEATRHMGGVLDRRAAWRVFGSNIGTWMLTGAGWWAIEVSDTGDFVGTVGAFFRESSLGLGTEADLELGWSILRPFWRQGYATEAARKALSFAFARHPVRRAIAQIAPENEASIRVSKAIGMTYEGHYDFYGEPSVRYVVPRLR